MFSYPIRRQKILASQMAAVWIFNFLALVLTKLLIYGCIALGARNMESSFGIDFSMGSVGFYIQLVTKSAVIVSMGFIALFVGLKMRSQAAVIVASFVLILLTQANIGDYSLAGNAVVPLLLVAASAVFAVLSVWNVEKRDLL